MYDVHKLYDIHKNRGYKNSLAWDTFRRFMSNIGILVHFGFGQCEIMQ